MAVSCQDNDAAPNEPDATDVVNFNAELVNILELTTANNGTLDDILDNASCLSVDLPVTVLVNETSITINSLEDLQEIEDLFDEYETDDDTLEFMYPITIMLNDYTVITIENEEELEAWVDECENAFEVIDCIDFVYPISFSVFDTNSQIIDTVTIESDWELYELLQGLQISNDAQVLASLNYPISMVMANGNVVEVSSNDALLEAIENAASSCNDDSCLEVDVDSYLTNCYWEVESYNGSDDFGSLKVYFEENGSLSIEDGDTTVAIAGSWQTSTSDQGVIVTLSELTAFSDDLEGNWLVVACSDEQLELEQVIGDTQTTIVLEQECEEGEDCSLEEVQEYLQECALMPNLNSLPPSSTLFLFSDNNQLETDGDNSYSGTWELYMEEGNIFLNISFSEMDTYNGVWQLMGCEEDALLFAIGDSQLSLTQDCESESAFECYYDAEISICDEEPFDGIASFDLNTVYENCVTDEVEVDFYETVSDAEMQLNQLISPYTNLSNPQIIYARVTLAGTDTFEIFEVELKVEDCNDCANPGIMTNDLIIYMPFSNEAINLMDGSEADGETFNFVEDRNGNPSCAVAFSGEDYFSIAVTEQNQLIQGDSFSVSLWFKMQNTEMSNYEQLFQKGATPYEGFQLAVYDGNTPVVSDTTDGYGLWDMDWNASTDLWYDITNWHHLVLTVDAQNTVRLYRDGVMRSVDENSDFNIDESPLENYISGQWFIGHLDDLRVYKRTLSPNEVGELFTLEADCFTCL
ncbi:LamG domain-containing protein [Mangrovimonas sp. YM274]|uniref:LamG domain-containing protein n=1 Tax=Mangrovimonas sp. YM274 TaxID=3070660 RepID=UPI0027DBE368|nr:LamG domain-containing protein [Mangrovimonas sp. YM274]WMI67957.1 LamG domain-containing protein [Mangrovimonas sp. YM274]